MSTTNELLREGIRAAKSGQIEKARQILKRVIEREPRNAMAWLWLSGVLETDEQRIACLENVLAINPANQAAQRGLQALRQKAVTIEPLPKEAIAVPTPTAPAVSRPQAKKSGPWAAVALAALVVLVVAFWCSDRWNAVFGTSSATSTPDPLAECRLLLPSYFEDEIPLIGRFEDDTALANNTARIALAPIVQRLQDTHREFKAIPPPDCAVKLHARTSEWMDWTIQGFHAFMAQDEVTANMHFQKALEAKQASLAELDRLPGPK